MPPLPRSALWALGGAAALGLLYLQRATLMNLARLTAALPDLPASRALQVLPHVRTMLAEADATSPARAAAMLAQVAHESGSFRYTRELGSDPGAKYGPSVNPELAKKLGNRTDQEARAFIGRGWIQLTGRFNFEQAGRALGLPLLERPELAEEPAHAARIAAWYWRTRGLNAYADRGDFVGLTRAINGGTNGLADRQRLHTAALAALNPTSKGAA